MSRDLEGDWISRAEHDRDVHRLEKMIAGLCEERMRDRERIAAMEAAFDKEAAVVELAKALSAVGEVASMVAPFEAGAAPEASLAVVDASGRGE